MRQTRAHKRVPYLRPIECLTVFDGSAFSSVKDCIATVLVMFCNSPKAFQWSRDLARLLEHNITHDRAFQHLSLLRQSHYHSDTFSFSQNSPVRPPMSSRASMTGVFAP